MFASKRRLAFCVQKLQEASIPSSWKMRVDSNWGLTQIEKFLTKYNVQSGENVGVLMEIPVF